MTLYVKIVVKDKIFSYLKVNYVRFITSALIKYFPAVMSSVFVSANIM
jgi:hypothetical protein